MPTSASCSANRWPIAAYPADDLRAGAGHTGGSLSCVDILNVLYNSVMDITPANFHVIERDHYVQSKGHAVEALYARTGRPRLFPLSDLDTLERLGSLYSGHPPARSPARAEHRRAGSRPGAGGGHGVDRQTGRASYRVFC